VSSPKRIIAALFEELDDGKGGITLRKITTTQWLTVAYIANTIGVSEQTMYRMIVDEECMPHSRFGYQIRVKAEDFRYYMTKCQQAEYERPGAK
jgi:excisionase family DNA binding protein